MATGDTLATFTPYQNEPPGSNYATLDLRNVHPVLDFDGSTDEEAVFTFVMPSNYGGGGVTVKVHYTATSATSGTARFQTSFERVTGQNIDSDSFATANSGGAATSGTSGIITTVSINHANGSEMDSCVAGDVCRLKIRRDADGTSGTDDIATDIEVVAVEIVEQ
jgi:hypothetical protein